MSFSESEIIAIRSVYSQAEIEKLSMGLGTDLLCGEEYVYAILARKVNRVKIGYSKDPKRRLRDMITSCPVKLELLGFIPGSLSLESLLHEEAQKRRIRGEWFEYSGSAKSIANAIRDFDLKRIAMLVSYGPSNSCNLRGQNQKSITYRMA